MLHPFYLDPYPVGQKGNFPPESCITMTHLPPSVKGIGDENEHPQDQCGDDNTRPNKNCPDHNIIKIRNPNIEIRNKFEIFKHKISKLLFGTFGFGHSCLSRIS